MMKVCISLPYFLKIVLKKIYLFCMYEYLAGIHTHTHIHIHTHTTCVPGVNEGQKMVLNPLEL